MRNDNGMKRNENGKKTERNRNESESYPGMTGNDCENGSSGKRLRNEFRENPPIFRVFSVMFQVFSCAFRMKKPPMQGAAGAMVIFGNTL